MSKLTIPKIQPIFSLIKSKMNIPKFHLIRQGENTCFLKDKQIIFLLIMKTDETLDILNYLFIILSTII
jgi:hypothetical protein